MPSADASRAAPVVRLPAHGTSLSCRLDPPGPRPGSPITVLHLAGEIDISTRSMVDTALSAGLHAAVDRPAAIPGVGRQAPGDLVIDVADLVFCSSGGLTQLMAAACEAAKNGAGCALVAPCPLVQRMTALLPAAEQIDTYPSIPIAVRDILRDRAQATGEVLSPSSS